MQAELLVDARAALGEGPLWHPGEQRLYWVDIDGQAIHVHDPAGEPDRVIPVGRLVGFLAFRRAGGLLIGGEGGIFQLDPASGRQTPLADPETGKPDMRFNDGKCDPYGRLWAGTYNMKRTPKQAGLYCLEPGQPIRRVLSDLTNSNGLGWSPDRLTFYHIDTPTLEVAAYEYDGETGNIANRRVAVRFPQDVGRPDGMTVDAEGMLWVAHFDGGRVTRWNPRSGRLLSTVMLPCSKVTSCTFGGPRLDRLFVTTVRKGLDDEALRGQPHAGGLYVVEPGVEGLPMSEYAG
jgi:sugar lactone lactonase YvrE